MSTEDIHRCPWAEKSALMRIYHDTEWGIPEHDDQKLFELLCMETYQAGLSWQTIINKRTAFNDAFDHYAIAKVAAMTPTDIQVLMENPLIVRNKLKLNATVTNAKAILTIQASGETFDHWLWGFVDYQPIHHHLITANQMPAKNELSETISKAMKKAGFKFVGPTTIYSYLQGAGLINDHLASCDFA